MGEGDLPKALDQVNGKFLVRYELGLFGLPFSPLTHLLIYKKSLSPFHNNKVGIQAPKLGWSYEALPSAGAQVWNPIQGAFPQPIQGAACCSPLSLKADLCLDLRP